MFREAFKDLLIYEDEEDSEEDIDSVNMENANIILGQYFRSAMPKVSIKNGTPLKGRITITSIKHKNPGSKPMSPMKDR